MSLGIYVSIPFCKAKCSFCNFASGVFAEARIDGYVARVTEEMRGAKAFAETMGAELPERVDSIYFGGGTPSLLEPDMIARIFAGIRGEFAVDADAEVTVECAPGQMSDAGLEAWQREGVNRLSFGVQSFVDRECAAVGRLHTGSECRAELQRMQAAGISRLGIDLIVGLPHQTAESWRYSVDEAIASGVEHVSMYMLEVDEDSRLGREALAGGRRYGAGDLPDEDRVADWYQAGCEWLDAAGLRQYEISNFARVGGESRHNRKYWERKPYVGFGLDAHSMLRTGEGAVRWANGDDLEKYIGSREKGVGNVAGGLEVLRLAQAPKVEAIGREQGFEEALFLGLRMNEGVDLQALRAEFGDGLVRDAVSALGDVEEAGLVVRERSWVRLTARGRMASNEVFGRLLVAAV